jgi:hypothetical protein
MQRSRFLAKAGTRHACNLSHRCRAGNDENLYVLFTAVSWLLAGSDFSPGPVPDPARRSRADRLEKKLGVRTFTRPARAAFSRRYAFGGNFHKIAFRDKQLYHPVLDDDRRAGTWSGRAGHGQKYGRKKYHTISRWMLQCIPGSVKT